MTENLLYIIDSQLHRASQAHSGVKRIHPTCWKNQLTSEEDLRLSSATNEKIFTMKTIDLPVGRGDLLSEFTLKVVKYETVYIRMKHTSLNSTSHVSFLPKTLSHFDSKRSSILSYNHQKSLTQAPQPDWREKITKKGSL